MRSTRALLATLGTSISLVAAGVAALFAVSTFVAFHGWPDIDDDGRAATPGLILRTGDPGLAPATNLLPAAGAIVLGARASAEPAERSGTRGARERSTAPPAAPDTPADGTTPAEGTAPAPVTAAPTPTGQAPVTDGTTPARTGDIVRDTTGAVGEALTPVSPTVGTTVQQTGETVAATVDSAAGVVESLLPAKR